MFKIFLGRKKTIGKLGVFSVIRNINGEHGVELESIKEDKPF